MHDISCKFAASSIIACSFFTKTYEIQGYKTRSSSSAGELHNLKTNQLIRSFTRFVLVKLWNSIAAEIRQYQKKAFYMFMT